MSTGVCNNCGGRNTSVKFKACDACRAYWRARTPTKKDTLKTGISSLQNNMTMAMQHGAPPDVVRKWHAELNRIAAAV